MTKPKIPYRDVLPGEAVGTLGMKGRRRAASTGSVGVLIPSYFVPGSGGPGGVGDGWAAMASAANQIPLTAVINPHNGPVPGPADSAYIIALTNLELAGGKTIGYIPTGKGAVPPATVEDAIQTYLGQYGTLIKGFFLDEMWIIPDTLTYYQSLLSFIKSLDSSYTVVGNPGIPFLNGVTPEDFMSTADILNIFEGPNTAASPGEPGFDAFPYGFDWFQSFQSARISNIVHDVLADAGDPGQSPAMVADLTKAIQLNAGMVYFIDGAGDNTYAALPAYWDQEVAAILTASVPEP